MRKVAKAKQKAKTTKRTRRWPDAAASLSRVPIDFMLPASLAVLLCALSAASRRLGRSDFSGARRGGSGDRQRGERKVVVVDSVPAGELVR